MNETTESYKLGLGSFISLKRASSYVLVDVFPRACPPPGFRQLCGQDILPRAFVAIGMRTAEATLRGACRMNTGHLSPLPLLPRSAQCAGVFLAL